MPYRKLPQTPGTKQKMQQTLHEFKAGTLHSGSKSGPVVRKRKQALAIGLSQAKRALYGP